MVAKGVISLEKGLIQVPGLLCSRRSSSAPAQTLPEAQEPGTLARAEVWAGLASAH